MKLILAVILAVSPGLINWWLGRRLLATDDAATLPERLFDLRQRLVVPVCLALIGCAALAWRHLPWLLLLLVASILVCGFKVRKAIYHETWSLAAYLSFLPRLWLAFYGFWALLAMAPLLLRWVEPRAFAPRPAWYWAAAIVLGVILALWSHFHGRVLLALLRGVPFAGAALEPYRDVLARIDEQSRATKPDLWLLPMVAGGRWANAAALPSTTAPRVLFTSTLLETLEPDEVGAVYAHEIGHLEVLTHARLRRLYLLELGLILLAVLAAPLSILRWLWPLMVLIALHWIGKRRRKWETDADLRALELCGDAEILIRALTTIHRLSIHPRRVPLVVERAQTHPSLARRIQAIRQAAEPAASDPPAPGDGAASGDDDGADGDDGATASPLPLALRGVEDGTAVVLDHDRISWFEGAGAESTDPGELLAAARASRTVTYRGLVELRIEQRLRKPPVLQALEIDGLKRSLTLPVVGVGKLQEALDQIDDQLASELTRKGRKKLAQPGRRENLRSLILWIIIFGVTILVWQIYNN